MPNNAKLGEVGSTVLSWGEAGFTMSKRRTTVNFHREQLVNKEIENSVRPASVFVDGIHPRRFTLSLLLLAEKARKVLFTTQFCCAWTTFYHLLFLFRIVAPSFSSIFLPAHHPMLMFSSAC